MASVDPRVDANSRRTPRGGPLNSASVAIDEASRQRTVNERHDRFADMGLQVGPVVFDVGHFGRRSFARSAIAVAHGCSIHSE